MHIQRWVVLTTAILVLQACRSPSLTPDSTLVLSPAPVASLDEPPVEETAEVEVGPSPSVSTDLWSELRAGFALSDDLPLAQPRFAHALAWITAEADLLTAMEPRARRYLPYVVERVKARGLPLELALLPIIESTLDPYAASPQGAAGLWQLIPGTARRYGVSINWWYDGRRDLVDSTEAALDYLEALHAELGDWLLAIAAYNCGERRIIRARARNPNATFWDVQVPKETARYVPRVLALAAMIQSPEAFGAELPKLTPEPVFGVSEVDDQIDLASVAHHANIPLDEIFRLNPGLNHSVTPPEGPHRLLLPIAYVTPFESAVDRYRIETPKWTHYRVRKGDTLGGIAARHGTTVGALRESNSMRGHLIRPGDVLVIPQSRVAAGKLASNPLLRRSRYTEVYRVASGDSLWSISQRLGVSVGALVRANHLDPRATLRIGQRLSVPGRVPVAAR